MAEQQQHYDFSAVEAKDILADRQRGWEGFVQFTTWGIIGTVVILVALLIFVV